MNNILFIIPPSIEFEDFVHPPENVKSIPKSDGNYGSVLTDMPLGILSLSAYVKHISQTKLIDFNIILNKLPNFPYTSFSDLFYDTLSNYIAYSPSIIVISTLFTSAYNSMIDIARISKTLFPNSIVVSGGGVPTNMYKEIFEDTFNIDALCYGEGEKSLLSLIKSHNKLLHLEENSSWITRKTINNPHTNDMIENLDEIPIYDYDILNINEYRLNSTLSAYPYTDHSKKYAYFMTSRGCTHHCCFCSSHTIHGRKMRYYSLSRIKEDITIMKDKYGIQTIVFQDDHFMADKKRALEIISILKELNMTAFFPNAFALYAIDKHFLQALQTIGVKQIVMAIESGSNRTLRQVMHKPLNTEIIKRVADYCHELGIYTDANIIIGLPGETKKDIEDGLSFLRTANVNWFRTYIASPLVGSEMHKICIDKNYIHGEVTRCNFKKAVIQTEEFTSDYIQEMSYIYNLDLNFVNNSDMRLRNHKLALTGFENTIRVKDDHAFAYYYAAKCCKSLNLKEKYMSYKTNYEKIKTTSDFWKKYIDQFKLEDL